MRLAFAIAVLVVVAGWSWRRIHLARLSVPAATAISAESPGDPRWPATEDIVYLSLHDRIVALDSQARIVRAVRMPVGAHYSDLGIGTLGPDERQLILPTVAGAGVVMFDLESLTFGRWYPMPGHVIVRAALSHDGRTLIAVDQMGRLYVLDAATGEQLAAVSTTGQSFDGLLDRQGNTFFLPNRDAGTLSFINLITRETRTIRTALGAHDIVSTTDGTRAFVTNEYAGSVSCIDVGDQRVITTVAVGRAPIRLAADPRGNAIYVSNRDSGSISVVSPASCEVRETLANAVPENRAAAVGSNRDGSRLYVASWDRFILAVYDSTRWPFKLIATLDLQGPPRTIVPAPRRPEPAPTSALNR